MLRLPQDIEKAKQILYQSRIWSKKAFETKYATHLQGEVYEPGTLVLVRNVPMENTIIIERKTTHRHMGPYSIVRRTEG